MSFDWPAVIVAAVFQLGSFAWGYWMGRRDAIADRAELGRSRVLR